MLRSLPPTILFGMAFALSSSALADTAADKYTWGPLYGPSQGYPQAFWINNNIPSGCRWTATDAGTKWTNATLKFTFTYKGAVTAQSWAWNGGDNISTTSNNTDTQVESGIMDNVNYLAQVERRVRSKTGDPNVPLSTDRYVFSDADVLFDHNRWTTTFWCSSVPAPNNMYDVNTIALHEFGHVLGLEHDRADTANVTVVNAPVGYGMNKRTLTARDVERAVYLYGAP